MTTNALIERIRRESQGKDLFEFLARELSPTDLQSLLLEVYRQRAEQVTPAALLASYERNRFVRPAQVDPMRVLEVDQIAFSVAAPLFEPLELAPVCPLGTNAAVATVDQNKTVTTIRNTEVVSDSTNVLALECAVRRRAILRAAEQRQQRVRLCASHRLLRAQPFSGPVSFAHFRLFGLCTAGRDEGSYRFELEALTEQISLYLRLFSALEANGYQFPGIRVAITDLAGDHTRALQSTVIDPLVTQFPRVQWMMDPERSSGRNYYTGLCFAIYARDREGIERNVVDGGLTEWTQQLLSNQKERLLTSGIGTERLCSVFRQDE